MRIKEIFNKKMENTKENRKMKQRGKGLIHHWLFLHNKSKQYKECLQSQGAVAKHEKKVRRSKWEVEAGEPREETPSRLNWAGVQIFISFLFLLSICSIGLKNKKKPLRLPQVLILFFQKSRVCFSSSFTNFIRFVFLIFSSFHT